MITIRKQILLILLPLFTMASCTYNNAEEISSSVEDKSLDGCDTLSVYYLTVVKPILAKNCYSCHGANAPSTKLTTYADVKSYVTNGKLEGSVKRQNGYNPMPPDKKLSACEVKKIERWIDAGAEDN